MLSLAKVENHVKWVINFMIDSLLDIRKQLKYERL